MTLIIFSQFFFMLSSSNQSHDHFFLLWPFSWTVANVAVISYPLLANKWFKFHRTGSRSLANCPLQLNWTSAPLWRDTPVINFTPFTAREHLKSRCNYIYYVKIIEFCNKHADTMHQSIKQIKQNEIHVMQMCFYCNKLNWSNIELNWMVH